MSRTVVNMVGYCVNVVISMSVNMVVSVSIVIVCMLAWLCM